jgi:hypothetical protein
MLSDYRRFLLDELKLLSNASHHAYSFGQANMAKRAVERLDEEIAGKIVLELDPGQAEAIREALLGLEAAGPADEALVKLERLLTDVIERPAEFESIPLPPDLPTV